MTKPAVTNVVLDAMTKVRFWEKVRRGDGCWLWTAAKFHTGYGRLRATDNAGGAHNVSAHRLSWMIHFGPIPDNLRVLHRCDNPPCVNPAHLFLGTQADNVADAIAKGRARPTFRTVGVCRKGHAYTPDNIFMHGGYETCRTCVVLQDKASYQRRKLSKTLP